MTITPHLIANESPTDELAMLLVGDYKAGKSYLAATAPGNIFILDFDQRLAALRGHPNYKNIYGMTFSDNLNAPSNVPPTAFNEMQDVLAKLEASPRLADVHSMFKDCGDKLVDTIVFDSVQSIADAARRFVNFSAPDVAKVIVMGQKAYRVAKTFHSWGGEMEMVTGAILQARALLHCKTCLKSVTYKKDPAGVGVLSHTDAKTVFDHVPVARAMNVICTLHECMEEDERSTQENPIYTGKIEVYPRRYNSLLMYFNEVWRLQRPEGRLPFIQFDPNNKFIQAATALPMNGDQTKTLDIRTILRSVKRA
jgi:hypothetical protein